MNFYTKIPIWETRKRIKLLGDFRNLVTTYFNNTKPEGFAGLRLIENDEAVRLRSEINRILNKMYKIVIASGVDPTITYTPAPSIGGYVRDVPLLHNMFNLSQFEISPKILLDYIERPIGIYESDQRNAIIRTLNPFFWLGLVFECIAAFPFKIIGKIGFDQSKVERSLLGRTIKGIFYLIIVFASLLTALNLLGYLDNFKNTIKNLLKL